MDGVTIGHTCCSVHECKVPLSSKRDRFCTEHSNQQSLCRVIDCPLPAEHGYRSCSDIEHRKLDEANSIRGKSFFQLRARLQRQTVSNLVNAPSTGPSNMPIVDLEADDTMDEQTLRFAEAELQSACQDKPDGGNRKLRARWGRRQTHNEQLIVRPCGVILARQTFYGSEGLSYVKVRNLE